MDRLGEYFLNRPYWLVLVVLIGLVTLPVAVWLDLKTLSDENLRRQASSLNSIVSSVRSYYASNVVSRVISHDGPSVALDNYLTEPGAIPIPATLSLELGGAIADSEGKVQYRFVSDFAFNNRAPHVLDTFERAALDDFRSNPEGMQRIVESTGNIWNRRITLATPVKMGGSCVSCHNTHPDSPRTDWEVGDVRGIQTVTVDQPVTLNILSFKWLLLYFALAGTVGLIFLAIQFRAAAKFRRLSRELSNNNEFLASVSLKISKYLSPQVYRSIFSGERDAAISTERKKLTVFFSDIKDFTMTTEKMQPEELTSLLNEYFTEMSRIAEAHGATIDKFIGDAIVAFFGDPETLGTSEDARACVRMALAMQDRLHELEADWRGRGFEHPFRARMGINTGYCNVGNFGSEERMDYTIIGAEANLAARMESIAEPGGIVMTYETYAHVRDLVVAEAAEPVQFKGVGRQVTPYHAKGAKVANKLSELRPEIDDSRLVVDLGALDDKTRAAVQAAVRGALRTVKSP